MQVQVVDLIDALTFVCDGYNLFSEGVDFAHDAVVSRLVDSHHEAREIAFVGTILDDGAYGIFGHLPVHGADGERDCLLGAFDGFSGLLVGAVIVFLEQVRFDEELQDVADLESRSLDHYLGCYFTEGRFWHQGREFAEYRIDRVLIIAEGVSIDDADFVQARFAFEFVKDGFFFLIIFCVAELDEQGEIGVVETLKVHGACHLGHAGLAQAGFPVADELEVGRRYEPGKFREFTPCKVRTPLAFIKEIPHILAIIVVFNNRFHVYKNNTKIANIQ